MLGQVKRKEASKEKKKRRTKARKKRKNRCHEGKKEQGVKHTLHMVNAWPQPAAHHLSSLHSRESVPKEHTAQHTG